MSHDNFMDYGLGTFGSGGMQACPTDLYSHCSQPLGPGINLQIKRGNCAEVLPFSKSQQNQLLSAMSVIPRTAHKNEVINYIKPPWSGVL